MVLKLRSNVTILLDRMGDLIFDDDRRKVFPSLPIEKSLSCGMQVDREEVKESVRPAQRVATVDRGLQVSPELTQWNLLQFSQAEAALFKVPKLKKKQRAKGRDQIVARPRKRIFHEANYSDIDYYDFGV